MRGVVFLGNRELAIRSFAEPQPGSHEVVLRMRASGLCGSDLPFYRSARSPSTIMGHEPAGEVVALGPAVTGVCVGDRAVVHHYEGCGACQYCRVGYYQLCVHGCRTYGFDSHGGHADYLLADASTLVMLPEQLSFEEGAALGCGTSTAYMALKKLEVSGRDTVAIYGQGPVGLSATLLAKYMGARVIAVDVVSERLEFGSRLGAHAVVNAADTDPVSAVLAMTDGQGADAALDCTGSPMARVQTVRSVRVFGRACYVGEGGTVTLEPTPDIIHRHLTLYGSWTFPTVGLEESARFVVERQVPLHQLIAHRFDLDEVEAAYKQFDAGATGKTVIVMGD